ncbi:PAAR domain-containing protein [Enterovirga sp. CN4-39]|uniref:PAAR domain-containing protein n=1 Tax=Enterovirga sp. CN4-39 TaxID=3400910 RepID=UPI003C0D4E3B
MGRPAARVTDITSHGPPLNPGPGSPNVLIGKLPAWRGLPAAAAAALQAAQQASDAVIKTAEAATVAAAGTPGAPAAYAAEQAAKTAAATAMSSLMSGLAAGAAASTGGMGAPDMHVCPIPTPVPPHGPGYVIDGSQTVLVNGLPLCRQGDKVLEALGGPDPIAKGEFTVLVGG